MENSDIIKAEIYEDIAPKTAANFIKLVKEGFYDGLVFHRIIDGFMIQGGDPDGSGMGGPGYTIEGEFSQNGFDNPLKHTVGVLSMARTNDPNSAGSQFFIMVEDTARLDGAYAAFGKVVDEQSMKNVFKIAKSSTPNTELASGKSVNEIYDSKGNKVSVNQMNMDTPLTPQRIKKATVL